MFIRVQSNQVPLVWDSIKYAATNADRVNPKDLPAYLLNILYELLCDRAQCFVRYGEDKILTGLVITKIMTDEMTKDKSLSIYSLYSFQSQDDGSWINDLKVVEKFAKNVGCKRILAYSNNPRVFELSQAIGFEERYRCFSKLMEA